MAKLPVVRRSGFHCVLHIACQARNISRCGPCKLRKGEGARVIVDRIDDDEVFFTASAGKGTVEAAVQAARIAEDSPAPFAQETLERIAAR